MALEIRLLRDNEHEKVIDFFNNAQSIDHKEQLDFRSQEIFDWEFCKGPAGKAIYIVAVDNSETGESKFVGIQCAIPLLMLTSKGNEILTAKSEDLYIDIFGMRKYKGRDILKEIHALLLEECARIGVQYLWGITNMLATHHRLHFEMVAKSNQAILVLKPRAAYSYLSKLNVKNTWKEKLKIVALSFISKAMGLKKCTISSKISNYEIIDRQFDNASLINHLSPDGSEYATLRQNEAYLKWRMFNNPSGIKYTIRQFVMDKTLYGELVYSKRNGLVFIEQMLFDAGVATITRLAFVKTILSEISVTGAHIVRFNGYEHNALNKSEINILKILGFMIVPRGIWFAIKPVGQPETQISSTQIHLSRLYTQGII